MNTLVFRMLGSRPLRPLLGTWFLIQFGVSLVGAPLRPGDIPAEPAWIVHVDCDRLRPTVIGQYLFGELDKPDVRAKFASFQSIFNFDARKQLHALTLYSLSGAADERVLLFYADFDPHRLETLIRSASDYQSALHNDHVIHSWSDKLKKLKKGMPQRIYAAIEGSRLIFGESEAPIAEALDVLDGKVPNFSTTKSFAQFRADGGTSLAQAAARKLDLPDSSPSSALFKLSKLARLEIGESHKQLSATLHLQANDETIAAHVIAVTEGVLALLKLRQQNSGFLGLLQNLKLRQNRDSAIASLTVPAAEFVELLKQEAARKAEKRSRAKH